MEANAKQNQFISAISQNKSKSTYILLRLRFKIATILNQLDP